MFNSYVKSPEGTWYWSSQTEVSMDWIGVKKNLKVTKTHRFFLLEIITFLSMLTSSSSSHAGTVPATEQQSYQPGITKAPDVWRWLGFSWNQLDHSASFQLAVDFPLPKQKDILFHSNQQKLTQNRLKNVGPSWLTSTASKAMGIPWFLPQFRHGSNPPSKFDLILPKFQIQPTKLSARDLLKGGGNITSQLLGESLTKSQSDKFGVQSWS